MISLNLFSFVLATELMLVFQKSMEYYDIYMLVLIVVVRLAAGLTTIC